MALCFKRSGRIFILDPKVIGPDSTTSPNHTQLWPEAGWHPGEEVLSSQAGKEGLFHPLDIVDGIAQLP